MQFPFPVRVKADTNNHISIHIDADNQYVYGNALNIIQCPHTVIYNYTIVFATGVTHAINIDLVEVCVANSAC